MKKLKYILFLLTLFITGVVFAQQDPIYTEYMNQLLSINPAYAGSKGVTSASLIVREQWMGWEGNPSTQTLFVHSPLSNETGIGGTILSDEFGPERWLGLYGDYSFTITYPGQRYLSLGLKAGFSSYRAMIGGEVPGDPAFAEDINRNFLPNAGVGVYLSSPKYYLGFSIPKLISNKITNKNIETNYASREQIHAFFMGGYVFDVYRILKFKPYFMARMTPNAPISVDLTIQVVFIEKLWLGATYRLGNAAGFMAQIQVSEQLKFGFAYDLTTTDLRPYNTGTLEGMLTYDFSFGRSRVRSPRYF